MADPANSLTTLARCKAVLNIASGTTTFDTQIEGLEGKAASIIEKICGRVFINGTSDVTEYYDVDECKAFFYVKRKPIISITSIYEDTECKYGSTTLLVQDTTSVYGDYRWNTASGRIDRIGANWMRGTNAIKITYKGGYSAQTDLETADPGLVEQAAWFVAWLFNQTWAGTGGGKIGLSAKGKGDGSVSYQYQTAEQYVTDNFSAWFHQVGI